MSEKNYEEMMRELLEITDDMKEVVMIVENILEPNSLKVALSIRAIEEKRAFNFIGIHLNPKINKEIAYLEFLIEGDVENANKPLIEVGVPIEEIEKVEGFYENGLMGVRLNTDKYIYEMVLE